MATKEKSKGKKEIQEVQRAHEMSPFDQMDRIFDDMFSRGWLRPFSFQPPEWPERLKPFEGKMPRVDVIDRDDTIVVKAELPGVSKDDIDISVTRNTVSISAKTSHEEKEEKGDYFRSEMSRGSFSRSLALPSEVNEDKVDAKFKDGVLELKLPKIEKAKRRKIKVK